MRQRLIAVAVVVASACTALHYSMTSQSSIVISSNPYHFSIAGSQTFVLSPANQTDDDVLQSIYFDNCNSQWTLDTTIDSQQPVTGAHVCGGLGSGMFAVDNSDNLLVPCPRNYQFAVHFAGTLPGVSSCNVIITSMPYLNGSAYEIATLSLSGSGTGIAGITVSPTAIDFKEIQINTTSSPTLIEVKNNGSASVTVNGVLNGSGFAVSGNYMSFSLSPGGTAPFDVTCNPPTLGPRSGTLAFTAGPSSASVKLDCTGIDSTVTVAPTQVNFDSTLVGRAPPSKTVIIDGNSTALIETVELDSAAAAAGVTIVMNPAGQQVGSGQSVVLAYSAAAMHAAGPLGALSIKVDSDATARSVGISGEALLGGVGTNPAGVEFGAVCIGGMATKDIEVFADEAGDIMLKSLTKPAAPFDAMEIQALPKTLSGLHSGPSVDVRVKMTPTAPGDFRDALALVTDIPNAETSEVQIHGIGVAAGIAATPDFVHFGTTAPGTTTSIKEIQLTNCGTTDLAFMRASITGGFASEFTLIGANAPRTLKPTESEIFMVVMQPETEGYKTAQLVIEHSEGTTTAQLDGTGEGDTNPKDRETYYACSTGRGSSLLPIAFALLLLRRRRKGD